MQSADLAFLKSTYLYQPGRDKPLSGSALRWAAPVRELLATGYSFLPLQYSNGHLFRGLATGIRNTLACEYFDHCPGNDETNRAERAMGIYFLTHEISDAIAASALHVSNRDNAMLVIKADYFNRLLRLYQAAVLAIGDAGFVFRYPFVTGPIGLDDIDYIVTSSAAAREFTLPEKLRDKHIPLAGGSRQELEHDIRVKFEQMGITPASPVASNHYPRL